MRRRPAVKRLPARESSSSSELLGGEMGMRECFYDKTSSESRPETWNYGVFAGDAAVFAGEAAGLGGEGFGRGEAFVAGDDFVTGEAAAAGDVFGVGAVAGGN